MPVKSYHMHLKGSVGGPDFDSDKVDDTLAALDRKRVSVLVNSTGGSLATGLSISAAFRNHGNVSVHFVGLNASAATVASLGAKHVSIDRGAMYLIHQCSVQFAKINQLNASQFDSLIAELRQTRDDLDKIDRCLASMYAARCRKPEAELLELMKVGGWLSPQEALDWGFVDEITDYPEDVRACIDESLAADFSKAGIPVPVLTQDSTAQIMASAEETSTQEDDRSLFARVLGSAAAFFAGARSRDNRTSPPLTSQQETSTDMNRKIFNAISAAVKAPENEPVTAADDGSLSLSATQAEALEDAVAALAKGAAELTARVAELEKAPAAPAPAVVDNAKGTPATQLPLSDAERFVKSFNNARALADILP